MDREIKFRVWDKEKKELNISGILGNGNSADLISICFNGALTTQNLNGIESYVEQKSFLLPRDRFLVLQYTGLLDKNNIEIYEGDIVRFYTLNYPEGINRAVEFFSTGRWIPFNDDEFIQDEQGDWIDINKHFEIIGNIFENQELLK